jgi:hypothetical protein
MRHSHSATCSCHDLHGIFTRIFKFYIRHHNNINIERGYRMKHSNIAQISKTIILPIVISSFYMLIVIPVTNFLLGINILTTPYGLPVMIESFLVVAFIFSLIIRSISYKSQADRERHAYTFFIGYGKFMIITVGIQMIVILILLIWVIL